ncbi:carbohydrate ABC transporter permease [Nocardioides sp. B-3]|uniref:carbohydrate ABC transporter permease n=1 Tax=Nocardioides sp. B-3 TaxID=2895565 RepID=UPI00215362CB|nr:sugar ABC transporter permease [Nocardioides sp. B-3]UUZ57801.1 sugar ABC transporter permease [Nocardioides sp. B-3]
MALCFTLAFTNARLISPEPMRFTGLDNFERLFADPLFWKSLRNTAYFAIVVVPLQSALALLLAISVNGRGRAKNFFRTLYFVPVVTSIVVVSILWRFMYAPTGLVNNLLQMVTFNIIDGTDWLSNGSTAMPAIIVMSIWQAVGFHMVIWLSGLQTIPGDQYEAAALDGASEWDKFRFITWPGLKETRTFIMVTITIAALSLFAQIQVMTNGGPLDATSTVIYQAVRAGYTQQQTGYASAISPGFLRAGAHHLVDPAVPHPRQGCPMTTLAQGRTAASSEAEAPDHRPHDRHEHRPRRARILLRLPDRLHAGLVPQARRADLRRPGFPQGVLAGG